MAQDSVAPFVDLVCRSRVLNPAQETELRQSLQPLFSDARALAWHLIDLGWLTTYQLNQLFQGHGSALVLGDYILLERLGQGGIGQVFKALSVSSNEVVALKVIRPDLLSQTEAIRQFAWEIQVSAQMSHPNVVRTLDASQEGGRYFFAMEYVRGAPLGKIVQSVGPLPTWQAAAYARQAALGLQHAHEHNLIHRDIKPANLFLTLSAEQSDALATTGWDAIRPETLPALKILDWGLASLRRPSAEQRDPTPRGETIGTADYLAPEQAQDPTRADIRADIYSLGCTLYFMVSGQPPFPGGSILQKVLKHQQAEPSPLTDFRRDLPLDLLGIVRKMMAKRREDRYQTPLELADALEPLCRPKVEAVKPTVAGVKTTQKLKLPTLGKGAERRAAVRYSCNRETTLRSLTASTDISWPAEVLDISRGGLGLLLDRRFEQGTLLDIDLQMAGRHSVRTLIVRVVNVRKQGIGQWILGCAFADELSDAELWAFRADRVKPASPDCRAWFRFPCNPEASRASVVTPQETWPARVINISPGGVALEVSRHVEAGAQLRLELQGSEDHPAIMVLGYVIHSTAQANGDWMLGCAFANELTHDELQTLL